MTLNNFVDIHETKLILKKGSKLEISLAASYTLTASYTDRATYRNPVRILLPDFLALGPPLLERVLLFVLKLHR